MPRDHARVLIRIWADDDFTALTETAQRFYVLLMSQEHINRAGVIDLRPRRWARLAADSSLDTVAKAIAELDAARFIAVDDDTEELLVRSFIRNDGIAKQPNVLKNALNAARQVQSRRLREILAEELRKLIDLIPVDRRDAETNREGVLRVADLLFHPNAKGSSNPSRNPSPNPSSSDRFRSAENPRSETRGEPFGEPFPEPFAEPFVEPPGEGEGVGEVVISPSSVVASKQQRAQRPTPEQLNATATDPKTAAILTAWRAGHDPRYSGGTYTAIGKQVAKLLADGTDADIVKAALAEWDRRADAKPGLLPHLVDDVLHSRRPGAALRPVVVNGTPTVPVEQIPDDAINPDEILGPDYWTPPVPPRDIDEGPDHLLREWMDHQVAERRAERLVEARRALIRRQNRSSA